MKFVRYLLSVVLVMTMLVFPFASVTSAQENTDTSYSAMLARAEAMVNYEWTPSERIYTWNGNLYNGKNYFEAGEVVKGVPYTLFSWELGFDSLLSLEQYEAKSTINYSTSKYCSSVSDNRVGPAYGNCCATFVSEVFGGNFMNGSNPRYDGVGTIQNSTYSTTYKNVKVSAIQPGDALSCTSGAHIVWVGSINSNSITIYESTPPVCQKVVLDLATHTDSNGYLVYGENKNIYNIVTRSNEIIRDDLATASNLSVNIPTPIKTYTKLASKTIVYDDINGTAKANKIYGTDVCIINAVFENGWCHVTFPLDAGGLENGYVETTVFFDVDFDCKEDVANSNVTTYTRDDLSTSFGKIASGSNIVIVDDTDTSKQIIYPLAVGGYKLGWVTNDDFSKIEEEAFLSQFCPIKGYPCVSGTFEVYQSDYSTRGGEIYISDYCTINEVYSDGWCQVTFPLDSGGERTAYTPISNFVYNTDYEVYSYVTQEQIDVYTKKDLATYQNWWTGVGDTIYILGEYNNALQICYPIDVAYGGGYKLGWIPSSSISVEEKILNGVSINSQPAKTSYEIGEELETTGLSVELTYSDGTTEIITSGFTVSGYDSITAGTKTITVSYGGKTTTFTVTVNEKKINEIAPTINVSSSSATAGSQVKVAISLKNNPGLTSMLLKINYDTDKLELVSVEDSGNLGTTYHSDVYNAPYTLNWVNDTATTNYTYNGEIVVLTFKVLEDAEIGETPITVSCNYENYDIIDKDMNPIEFKTVNGSVNIIDVLIGDVNEDGKVNQLDRVILTRYIANWAEYPDGSINLVAADVNCDGKVNQLDRVILTRYIANWSGYETLPYNN